MTALVTEVLRYIEHNSNSIQALLSGKGPHAFPVQGVSAFHRVCPIRYEKLFGKGGGLRLCGILPGFHPNGILIMMHYWLKNRMALPAKEPAGLIVELVWAIC